MKKSEVKFLIKVSKLYYEENMNQEEIAEELKISRAKVSRCLAKAKEYGYVKTIVIDPFIEVKKIEENLKKLLGLKAVRVATLDDNNDLNSELGQISGEYLKEILKVNDILGIAWGLKLKNMTEQIKEFSVENLEIVQLKGSVPSAEGELLTFSVAETLGKKLHGKVNYLNIPVMVKSKEIRDAFMEEPSIQKVVDLGKRANIAIFSIGYPSRKSTISRCGYISGDELEELRENGAVGEICSRFFKADGSIFDNSLNDRNTSIDLEELKTKDYAIGIAGGINSIDAIMAAIKGKYINTLILDLDTAQEIINRKG